MKALIILLFLGFTIFPSCDKLFLDVEGVDADIQGKWQLRDNDSIFYNFQGNLFQYQQYLTTDNILSVNGYYTLYGDSVIRLKLLPEFTFINTIPSIYPLDFLHWDTVFSSSEIDTLVQVFRLKKIDENELNIISKTKNYLFHKF